MLEDQEIDCGYYIAMEWHERFMGSDSIIINQL